MLTKFSSAEERITTEIMGLLLPHRRHVVGQEHAPVSAFGPQHAQIASFTATGAPILFTIPGFPCKSPNLDKVIGTLPDEGERLSLKFLDDLCGAITAVYPPGAKMLICSDGHVFGDHIGVPDETIDAYGAALRGMIRQEACTHLDVFDLGDVLGDADYDEKRRSVHYRFAPALDELRAEVRTDEHMTRLYRGITRFLVEDAAGHTGTKSALQRVCRDRAYAVIQRSNAWGSLIAEQFPSSVRLSIHPQPVGSAKFGIRLLAIEDQWTTPWHSCLLIGRDGVPVLLPHRRARSLGELVCKDGLPSHYVAL
ncbi:L-tyrosine/L-tryptophan isonitrile synthase family protein [Lentzea sp. HUAS12]|uniref:L-tyrosine/L-tryptophan isonitrile synthase family protein n=1 Tax=Lentzea sp. HUAS12 TaxID=2951806 RepID=UPI00209D079F|nr:isocyanide synthase family protein [Lentzea sp. HUAS12]USX54018.1 isocyanide synthase family protein [Lentzea sp. HUAS12]